MPFAVFRIRQGKDNTLQFVCKFFLWFSGKPGHIGHIHAGPLRDGNGQRLSGGVHMLNRLCGTDRALRKQVGLAAQLMIFIQNFQRAEQIIRSVGSKGVGVAAAVDQAVLGGKCVIAGS